MPDNFDERLATAAARLEREATVGSPAGVRARGDQRRRRHAATMAVVPVAVLAIAGTVGLTLRPSGGASRQVAGGPPATSSVRTPAENTRSSATAAAAPVCTVDLAHHTLAVLDAQGKVVRTLGITAGKPAYPTRTGTFTVVGKEPSRTLRSSDAGNTYDVPVRFYIDLGPNAPALYVTPGNQAKIGKENVTHGGIELSTEEAAWLYNKLAVGDTIQIVAG